MVYICAWVWLSVPDICLCVGVTECGVHLHVGVADLYLYVGVTECGVHLCVGVTECDVVAVDIKSLQIVCRWKAADNSVLMLRTQTLHSGQSMLGVADLHSGITVYDLCVTLEGSSPPFSRLYHVDVDEVRHFELVGACVAVFHRREPNVSFWNVLEHRTILCINVQEQARKLSEEFIVDNEEDADGNSVYRPV